MSLSMKCLVPMLGILPIVAAASAESASHSATNLLGFDAARAAKQRALEKEFDARLDRADQRAWLERLSAAPNHVGSPHNRANAEFMLEQFREWGWDAHLETFYVLYPTPRKVALELIAPTQFAAGLHEPAM